MTRNWRGPAVASGAIGGLAALVVALIGLPGASAAPGPTDLSLTKNDSADPVVRGTNFALHDPGEEPGSDQ